LSPAATVVEGNVDAVDSAAIAGERPPPDGQSTGRNLLIVGRDQDVAVERQRR
jgi:hypothetical protein